MAAQNDEDFVYRAKRQGQKIDPAIRRMALGAGGVSVLVILVALLWSGVQGPGFGPPPVISPPPGPIRVLPADPGGLTVPEANEQIMSGDVSGPPELAPASAAPAIAQLDQAAGVTIPPPTSPPVSVPAQVQLAATADEQDAVAAWQKLQTKLPQLFSGKTPEIVPAVVNGQSVWRLRLGGFASAEDAKAFCATVTAQGAACMVATF